MSPTIARGRTLAAHPTLGSALTSILAGIAIIGVFSAVALLTGRELPAGQKTRIGSDLRTIIGVADAIHADTGRYPQSIDAMLEWSVKDAAREGAACICERAPRDPWGHEYLYEITPDGSPRVTCLGSDNRPGGKGPAADVVAIGHPREERR